MSVLSHSRMSNTAKTVVVYGLVVAAAATFLLQWMEYRYTVNVFRTELYVALIALGFTALGIWVGAKLSPSRPAEGFERNERVLETLGISARELEVLELLTEGLSNKEIAARLFVSSHTVKTHLSNLYEKLEVSRAEPRLYRKRECFEFSTDLYRKNG